MFNRSPPAKPCAANKGTEALLESTLGQRKADTRD